MTGEGGGPEPEAAPATGLALTRETLLALRDGRLPRDQARDVRARLSRDPDALALLGTLSSDLPMDTAPTMATQVVAAAPDSAALTGAGQQPSPDDPVPGDGGRLNRARATAAQRAAAVAVAAGLLVGALWWAGHTAAEPVDPRAAPAVPDVTMAQLGTLWPAINGRFDRDLLDSREDCQPFKTPLGAQGAVVDGRYSMVVAYTADGTVDDDEIELRVVPLNCNSSDCYPRLTVPR
ncbi:hypothetical protein [Actinomycetospora soli]|uniref:hypothetical protein n=1 Tax=Actinomycetospora soli TaxID=2893887 RepID=UPI001E4EFA7F|nr:hypothetical protein [Actinomycetospora soli]MCD2191230.1 hypothetical protein [Actinomycetospora soli]